MLQVSNNLQVSNPIQETGTTKLDRVSMKDFAFWLPHTKAHLRGGVPAVSTFSELVTLPLAQIGYILGVLVTIIRKHRKVGGERLTNVSLKGKVDSWQRIIRKHFATEDSLKILHDPN